MDNCFLTECRGGKRILTKYTGADSAVTVPDGIDKIGERAFSGCDTVLSVTLPDGLKAIEAYAFEGCRSLQSVCIPASVTYLGPNLFSGVEGNFDILYGGDQQTFENMTKVFISSTSYTDGDYHHPSGTHFTPTETVTTVYMRVFGNDADRPFTCKVYCGDAGILNFTACSGDSFTERKVIRY